MIAVENSNTLKSLIETSYNLKTGAGCRIEYNINSMVNSPTVTGPSISETDPFKKLFPVDSIVKANRPTAAGVKYYVLGDVASKDWNNPKSVSYSKNYRLYIPGASLSYKYYLSSPGASETISITYPKKVFVNKITIKFEISHSVPTSFSISGTAFGGSESLLKSGTSSNIKSFPTNPDNKVFDEGTVSIYYTGSGWSFSETDLNTASHVELSAVKLNFSAAAGEYVGVIALTPKYVIDIDEYVVDFSINKETTSDQSSVLPVGYVNSNTANINLSTYNKDSLKVKSYDRENSSFENDIIYFYKMSEVKPYIKIYHSAGTYGSSDKYDKIPQGTFYMDSSKITEYGDFTINALDGSKILQDIIPQDALCEKYSTTAIIRRMLDNVGFTNYKFNLDGENDTSVMTPLYWWTDDTKTVWEHIQELCRDSQMTAIFDENNVLQFYSREYLYKDASTTWTMYRDKVGDNLPNIIEFNKEDLPSANKVKILWQTPQKSNAINGGTSIWQSSETYLSAYGLKENILSSATTNDYISLVPITTEQFQQTLIINSFSGYLLINSEIIEFDAIEYDYTPISGGSKVQVDITSETDILKYNSLADGDLAPTGRYRIKTRGALNTATSPYPNHYASSDSIIQQWTTGATEFTYSAILEGSKNSKVIAKSAVGQISSKTMFTINNISSVPNHYEIAYKSFPSMTSQSASNIKYYACGTTFFFAIDSTKLDQLDASGGFAFFVSDSGTSMYYVRVRSTYGSNSLDSALKDVVIYKSVNGVLKELKDSQTSDSQITNIYGGIPYKIDITVKSTSTANVINLYINGNKITATDTFSNSNPAIAFSDKLGMISQKNKLSFDYVYGMDIDESVYAAGSTFNIYTGQYSNKLLNIAFGNIIFDKSGLGNTNKAVEDFGPVAREIRKDSIRFNTRPAYPLTPSLGINEFAKVLGYKLSPFGAETYVINNSAEYVALSDGNAADYFISGKTLSTSSPLEYTNYIENDNTIQEPVIFESTWIQTVTDAKNLADWIKNQWSKKQYILDMSIFGNPLISVGDIVEVNYPYQDLVSGQKFLITGVNQKYNGGLETNIICRTL